MTLVEVVLIMLAVAFAIALVRVAIGPTVADRAAAADVCFYILVGTVALFGLRTLETHYIDIVVAATLLGFIATIALASLLWRQSR